MNIKQRRLLGLQTADDVTSRRLARPRLGLGQSVSRIEEEFYDAANKRRTGTLA